MAGIMPEAGKPGPNGIRRAMPDLARLPLVFDIRAISLIEGLRAALSTAAIISASALLQWPGLMEAALAALFTCLCDVGGPIRRRVPALVSFSLIGALVMAVGGLVRGLGVEVALPFGVLVIFCSSFARVYGPQPQQVGMFLSVVLILSLDRALPRVAEAGELVLMFLLGGMWASVLTLVLWRIRPFKPVRAALAGAYEALALMTRDLQRLLQSGETDVAAWEFHARAHRRAVRTAIEAARTVILNTVRSRGPLSNRATQSLLRLETADQLFGALIALSELLETANAEERVAAAHMIRRLRPLLVVLGHEILTEQGGSHGQIGRSIAAMARDIAILPENDPLRTLAGVIVARLQVVLTVSATANARADEGPGVRSPRLWQALRTPVMANLSWKSDAFRHALRAAVTVTPALAYSMLHASPYDHWWSITIIVTMQPYFGNTFLRVLERVGGTTLGGLLAAGLGIVASTPLAIGMVMVPLGLLAFALRAVSYGLFVSFLTPMIVLLVELGQPGTSDIVIAGYRVVLTIAGGLSSVAGCFLLWPSWEPNRLPQEVRAAIAAHGRYAEAELSLILSEASATDVEQARRAAGLATNNVEASVARALLEPRGAQSDRVEAAMVIDAALRRLAGRLAAMQFDPSQTDALPPDAWREWRDWLAASMRKLGEGRVDLTPHPELQETAHTEALGRIARQVELIGGTIARVRA